MKNMRSVRASVVRTFAIASLSLGSLGVVPAATAQESEEARFRSEMEIRLMEMENRFRNVTGQYEEAMYRLTQMNRTLENTLADVEFRLQQLEQGAVTPAPAIGDGAPAVESEDTPAVADAPSVDAGGEISTSDVAALTAPAPAAAETITPETHPERYLEGETPEEHFRAAFFLVRSDDLDRAIDALRAFVALHPDHPYRANAEYWLGRSHGAKDDHDEAARILLAAYDRHADSEKGAEILLHLGLSLHNLGQNEGACSAFGELERRFADMNQTIRGGLTDGQQKAGCL
jgi:TolA-binding protein